MEKNDETQAEQTKPPHTLIELAAKALIKHIYQIHNGIKQRIETFIVQEFILKVDLTDLAIQLCKEYFYMYAKTYVTIPEIRKKQFLDIGIDYGFSIQELLDNEKILISSDLEMISNNLNLSYLKINSLEGLENIANIDKLVYLDLGHNQLSFLGENCFSKVRQLEWLILENNRIGAINPECFNNFHNLKRLNLSKNNISIIDLNNLTTLQTIEMIDLRDNLLDKQSLLEILKGSAIYNKVFM